MGCCWQLKMHAREIQSLGFPWVLFSGQVSHLVAAVASHVDDLLHKCVHNDCGQVPAGLPVQVQEHQVVEGYEAQPNIRRLSS